MENYSESFNAQIGSPGASAQPSAEPKPIQKLDGPATHLESMLKGMCELRTRLNAVADQLLGSVPEPVDNTGQGSAGGGGVVGRYQTISDNYATVLRKLFAIVDRLEKL